MAERSEPVPPREPATEPTSPAVDPPALPATARLELLGEIARGGMGAVLKGRDADLGRDVAVKVLLETHAGRPELVQRFVEEARIAGQLQHPGVTPVYELGQFPDKRPYFTMKLVKGQTLAKLLNERPDPASERPRFLKVFEQVCQTVAYAHSKGVIHRDLKPSNVMVGAFGEVQVMDWGLAKVLASGGRQPPEDVSVIHTARGADSETHAGSVLGTPSFMAPEQARGDTERLDERCDVFGLGGILCQILTGQPPYVGDSARLMRKAETAELADAFTRLEGSGADAELIALAKRCLAREPGERPRDAGALAAELTAYLESVETRLRQAEMDRATADVQAREERRRRKLTVGLAAAVVALVAVGATGVLWDQQQASLRRAERAHHDGERRQAAESALTRVAELQRKGRWREAEPILEQARAALGEAGADDLQKRLAQAEADLKLVIRLDRIRQHSLAWTDGALDRKRIERDYAFAFHEARLATEGEDEAMVAARLESSAIKEQLVAALDHWAIVTPNRKREAWLLGVTRRADPNPWRDRFRDPSVWRARPALEGLVKETLRNDGQKLAELSPQLLEAVGGMLTSLDADAVPLLKAALIRHPDDFWLHLRLGMAHLMANQFADAVGYCRAALALRPDSAVVHWVLGGAIRVSGQTAEVLDHYRMAVALDPQGVPALISLGSSLAEEGLWDEAIASLRKALELDPESARGHATLALHCVLKGNHENDAGPLTEAVGHSEKALALAPEEAGPWLTLGLALLRLGRFEEARAALGKGLKLSPEGNSIHEKLATIFRQCEQLIRLEKHVPALARGEALPPDIQDRLMLAEMCLKQKRLPATAARLYTEVFAAEPKVAEQEDGEGRYFAACAAALAGGGQGDDATKLDDQERARLRAQAREWLRANRALWEKRLESGNSDDRAKVRNEMRRWQKARDLAPVRDRDAVARLPAEEQEACAKLWEEIAALLKKAEPAR